MGGSGRCVFAQGAAEAEIVEVLDSLTALGLL
jgi:hypothetical protein